MGLTGEDPAIKAEWRRRRIWVLWNWKIHCIML